MVGHRGFFLVVPGDRGLWYRAVHDTMLLALTSIILLGFIAQWVGWRFHIPGILLLLGLGLFVGPVMGWLNPREVFGDDLIFPLVSMGVAIILFEGGLTLNFKEFQESGGTIFRLISVGALSCWALTAFFAMKVLGLQLETALLFGAILVITGPTVIGPMLRQIRPKGKIAYILKWEGILNDPVGAVLGVLILEAILIGNLGGAPGLLLEGIAITFLTAGVLGTLGSLLLVLAMRKAWLPDYLHISATLTVVLAAFTLSNKIQHESGLLTVTLMGILLANQKSFPVKHILEFKENLQVMLIGGLFIVLGARVEMETLQQAGWRSGIFILLLICIVRPVSVLVSTVFSSLTWKERFFLMLMAPRGIVVTALASLFAFRLTQADIQEGEIMFAETLFVILGTVIFYGVAAGIGAKKLGLSNSNPQGVLMVGAHPWARMIGVALKKMDVPVALIDSNPSNVKAAEQAGLVAYSGNIHSEEFIEAIDYSNIGYVLALTANDEINAFAERELAQFVGRARCYKLAPNITQVSLEGAEDLSQGKKSDRIPRSLFGSGVTFDVLERRFYEGATVKPFALREGFDYKDFAGTYGLHSLPLFLFNANGNLQIWTDDGLKPQEGQTLVSLTWNPESAKAVEQYSTL